MKIRFVTEGSINEYWESSPPCDCDVLFFGFNGLGEVDYRAELDGTTSKLEDLALLSRELGCVVVSGCLTDSCGIRHKSAAVAEGGKILGVADMLSAGDGEPYSCGAHLKVFETRAGKLGVCVGEDIYRPSLAEALALFDTFYKEGRDKPLRGLGVSAFDLSEEGDLIQGNLFELRQSAEKESGLSRSIDLIRAKYGFDSIKSATLIKNLCICDDLDGDKDFLPFNKNAKR